MASHTALLLNVAMIVLISLYAFGGDTPMVSLMTVTTGVITQLYCTLTNTLVSRVVQPSQKQCCVAGNKWSSSAVALMPKDGISHMVSYLTTAANNPIYHQLGWVFAVTVIGRLLEMSGLMTPWTASQASPVAFVLGMTVKNALPKDAASEDHSSSVTFFSESVSLAALKPHLTLSMENPYNSVFWDNFETPASNKDPIDKISLDPSDILSGLYHDLISDILPDFHHDLIVS